MRPSSAERSDVEAEWSRDAKPGQGTLQPTKNFADERTVFSGLPQKHPPEGETVSEDGHETIRGRLPGPHPRHRKSMSVGGGEKTRSISQN